MMWHFKREFGTVMAVFSSFPLAYWAEKKAHQIAVRWKRGNSPILDFLPEEISWQQCEQLAQQLAYQFEQNQIQPGDLIAYVGSNRLAGLLYYLSSLLFGTKIVMLNPAVTASQKQQILTKFGVKQCFSDEHLQKLTKNSPRCKGLLLDFSAPATLTLTSGSSGEPKAVVHSIENHLSNAQGVCELMNFTAEDSWLLSLPLFHVSGQGIIWRWLAQGATLVIVEDKTAFYPTLSEVSHASLVPTQLQRYLAFEGGKSQHILLGGSFIPANLLLLAQQKNITTYAGYGMTEMASTVCAVKNQIENVGVPLKGREVRLEQGEIWVRGAGLGLGYWLNQTLVPLVNAEGWFATKDKGEWLNGSLVICGRLDNQFISGGENIQPEEIERVLLQSGLVKQVIVVPISDVEFGQRPVAVLTFHSEFTLLEKEKLQCFAAQYLEKFKLPIHYLPFSLFSSQTGIKIIRSQLQKEVVQYLREQGYE